MKIDEWRTLINSEKLLIKFDVSVCFYRSSARTDILNNSIFDLKSFFVCMTFLFE